MVAQLEEAIGRPGDGGQPALGGPELAVAIQNDLKQIGITLKLNVLDPATWLAQARSTSFQKLANSAWSRYPRGPAQTPCSPLNNGARRVTCTALTWKRGRPQNMNVSRPGAMVCAVAQAA